MPRIGALALVLTTIAAFVIVGGLTRRATRPEPEQPYPSREAEASLAAKTTGLLHQTTAGQPIPSPLRSAHSPLDAAALLEQLGSRPRFKDVPVLDFGIHKELIRRYEAIAPFSSKHHILRMLAFRGDPQLVRPLLERVVTEEYAGQEMDQGASAQLAYVLQLLGILAARDDASLAFLMTHTSKRAWAGKTVWRVRSGRQSEPVPSHILAAEAIQGLGMSGRPEAADWLEAVKRGEQLEAREVPGAVLSAAFLWRMVNTTGLEHVMDEVVYSPELATAAYREWKLTSEGVGWNRWYDTCVGSQK